MESLKYLRRVTDRGVSFITFAVMLLFVTALALAGCSGITNALSQTISLNLSTAQSESQALLAAAQLIAGSSPSAVVASALSKASTAVADFVAIPAGGTYGQALSDVIADLEPVLIDELHPTGATLIAVDGGFALLEAYLAGQSSVTVTLPTPSATVGAAPVKVISGPIPIPVPAS